MCSPHPHDTRTIQVAVGGTFDRLHNGHKKLLSLAASVTQECLTIGACLCVCACAYVCTSRPPKQASRPHPHPPVSPLLTDTGRSLPHHATGITSAEMLAKKKNADQIEPLENRRENVRRFLASVFPRLAVDIVVLQDPFGPPAHAPDFDAIVVSSETIAGAVKINELRAAQGFRPLTVVVTRRTVSSLLSSTFIRNNLPTRRPPW